MVFFLVRVGHMSKKCGGLNQKNMTRGIDNYIRFERSKKVYSYRNRNFKSCPNVSGIPPVNLFRYRSKLTRFVKFPSSKGIVPLILLLYSSLSYNSEISLKVSRHT